MADIEHRDVVDPERHEPKGLITAAANQVYTADGGGLDSGAWKDQLPQGIDTALTKQILVADGAGGGSWKHGGSIHGEMIIAGNSTSVAIPAAVDTTLNSDTDYTRAGASLGIWQAGSLSGINFVTDKLEITVPGDYLIGFWSDIEISNTNTRVAIKFAINDLTPYSIRKISFQSNNANNVGNVAGQAILPNLTALDTLSLYVAADAATNIIVRDAGLILTLLDAT